MTLTDKLVEAKAKIESERDEILAKIAEVEAEAEKDYAEFVL